MSNSNAMEAKENVDDSESIASDESEEMTELDEDEFDLRRSKILAEMKDLENQFSKLKEELINERCVLLDQKLKEIEEETADEFTIPLKKIQLNMDLKIKLATLTKDYRLKNIEHVYECEMQSAKITLENEKQSLLERHKSQIENEIRNLEENRRQFLLDYKAFKMSMNGGNLDSNEQDIDVDEESEEIENNQLRNSIEENKTNDTLRKSKRNKTKSNRVENEFSPFLITHGTPFVVYSLSDYDIMEDLSFINMHKNLNRTIYTKC